MQSCNTKLPLLSALAYSTLTDHVLDPQPVRKRNQFFPPSITVKFRFTRTGRLGSIASGIQQIANRPDPVGNAQGNARRGPQGLVDAAEIVMGNVQANRSGVVR
jgi:hypothetical protein